MGRLLGQQAGGAAPGCVRGRCHEASILAVEGLRMAPEGKYPFPGTLDGVAKLLSSSSLVTAVPREPHRFYAQLALPSVTLIRGPPGDEAVQAWA